MQDDKNVNFMCQELDFTDNWKGVRSAQMSYAYFLVKMLDLCDTIFFVLRKRSRQISFLHVYHHVAILVGSYIAVSWAPGNIHPKLCSFQILTWLFSIGGHPWLFGLLNCFVHVVMYGYYFGSVYSPRMKENLTIKRSITQLQIVSHLTWEKMRTKTNLRFFHIYFSLSTNILDPVHIINNSSEYSVLFGWLQLPKSSVMHCPFPKSDYAVAILRFLLQRLHQTGTSKKTESQVQLND